jgi:hypothetical protein
MDFEELQTIWNTQNEEKMYAINESTLHATIQKKGRNINRLVNIFEAIMIGINLFVAIFLTVRFAGRGVELYNYLIPATYLIYTLFAAWRRRGRRQDIKQFDTSMLGELDKAIWQIDYVIDLSRAIPLYYILPIVIVFSTIMMIQGRILWAVGMIILMVVALFASRWEMNKFYIPKKHSLEALREKITSP